MADFGDQAQAITEAHIERSLKNRTTLSLPFSGRCLACDEPVPSTGKDKRRFCDAGCRTDWETERKRQFALRV